MIERLLIVAYNVDALSVKVGKNRGVSHHSIRYLLIDGRASGE
jgi:hypothetical protein